MDRVLTLEEAAKLKGVCSLTLRKRIEKGTIKAVFFRGGWKIRESELNKDESDAEWLSILQASLKTSISPFLIERAILKGKLPARRTQTKEYRVSSEHLKQWISEYM